MQLHRQEPWLSSLNPVGIGHKLWQNRLLLRQFTWRYVQMRHKGSFLGIFWTVANPLLVMSVYVFVFAFIFDGRFGVVQRETRFDYALGIFLSLSIMQLFLETLAVAPTSIISNPNFVKKVVFPLEILPLAAVGASLFHCVVSLLLVTAAEAVFGAGVSWSMAWLPIVVLPVLLLSAGVAWFMAAIGVFLRDLGYLTQFLSLLLMFVSAVFYPVSRIPHAFSFLYANPLLVALETCRDVALWHILPGIGNLAYLYFTGIISSMVGYFAFARLRPAFADVI